MKNDWLNKNNKRDEDYWIPFRCNVKDGVLSTKIKTLPDEVDDITYFKNKLFTALNFDCKKN